MDSFFKKHMSSLDEDDAITYIMRQMNSYRRDDDGGGYGGSRSNRHMDAGESNYKKLAIVYEMIEDFFEAKGLDPRTYIDSQRRGR